MQEENVHPSDEFLSTLGKFLIEKGRSVPFVMPAIQSPPVSNNASNAQDPEKEISPTFRNLRQALRQDKLETALEIRRA